MKSFIVRLRQKGQITLPVEVRRKLGLVEDDELILTIEDDRIVLKPLRTEVPSKYLESSDDEIVYAVMDPEFVPHYFEVKYRGKEPGRDT